MSVHVIWCVVLGWRGGEDFNTEEKGQEGEDGSPVINFSQDYCHWSQWAALLPLSAGTVMCSVFSLFSFSSSAGHLNLSHPVKVPTFRWFCGLRTCRHIHISFRLAKLFICSLWGFVPYCVFVKLWVFVLMFVSAWLMPVTDCCCVTCHPLWLHGQMIFNRRLFSSFLPTCIYLFDMFVYI